VYAWAGGAVLVWAVGAALAWAGGAALVLLVPREWEWSVRQGSLVQAGLLGQAEAPGPEEASGPADGLAADGLADGAADVGGRGASALASRWPLAGRTTAAAMDTVTILVSVGCPIMAG
jgi:hypothetical protein